MRKRPPPLLVVPRCCVAMQIALEIVAEHRRARDRADLSDVREPPRKPKTSSSR